MKEPGGLLPVGSEWVQRDSMPDCRRWVPRCGPPGSDRGLSHDLTSYVLAWYHLRCQWNTVPR